VKVADFGLVRAVNTVTSTTGAVLGTVSYLAPEQIEDGTADTRVDVYACGVVLYEMLTGARPHAGETPAQVLYQHLNEPVPAPSALVPGLPAELDAVVASATGREPAARPADAVALLVEVRQARSRLSHAQLDAVPPAARDGAGPQAHDNSEDRTSVIPRVVSPADGHGVHRTTRLEPPPPAPPGRERRSLRPSRGTLSVIIALVAILGIGTGVWYINSGQFTTVPPLLAKTQAQAEQRLDGAGLDVGHVRKAYSTTDKRGTVISTDPAAGARIRKNDSVDLTISLGPRTVHVPDLRGASPAEARTKLKDQGLAPGMVTYTFSDSVAKGAVISTDPDAGRVLRSGSAVALTVSRGKKTEVPDVTGESLDDAKSDLADAHLRVKVLKTPVTSVYDKGQVAKESPGEGSEAAEGDTVTLTVSKGPVLVEVPDVTGEKVDDAKQELASAGFEVKVDHGIFGIFGDTVKDQSVKGGKKAPKGSTITLKVK
jgi:serine/threonine-protein kinase